MRNARYLWMALSLLAGACGGQQQGSGEAEGGTEGMAMRGMPMPSLDKLPGARAYLDTVLGAAPGELPGMVAGHRGRIEPMLTAMDQDMTAMNMAADTAWQALADSVRSDVATLPGLSGEVLVLRMRAHAGRMRRLLGMHEQMMRM